MNKPMNQTLAGVILGIVALGGPRLAEAGTLAPNVTLVWRFGGNANPAGPDVATGGAPTARATVTPGKYASAWLNNSLLGAAQGVWDLGNQGKITLADAAGLAGPTSQAREVAVSVVQYYDGMIYNERTTVGVAGATLLSSSESTVAAGGSLGDWIVQETRWEVPAGVAVDRILINGAAGNQKGSVIDQVSVQSYFTAAGSVAALNIRRVAGDPAGVAISWSAEQSGLVLETASDLTNPNGWTPVTEPAQLSGSTYTVTLQAAGAGKFYRLKQP